VGLLGSELGRESLRVFLQVNLACSETLALMFPVVHAIVTLAVPRAQLAAAEARAVHLQAPRLLAGAYQGRLVAGGEVDKIDLVVLVLV
jgi:hypothetical protein